MKDHLDRLFVLCCLWDSRAYIRLFLGIDPGSVFNINYEPKNCLGAIEGLFNENLLEVKCEDGGRADDWLSLIENSYARDPGNKLIVGLTKAGGSEWEKFFHVNWSCYVSELYSGKCSEWFVRAFDLHVVEDIFRWAESNGVINDFDLRLGMVNHLVYWKVGSFYEIKISRKKRPLANGIAEGLDVLYKMIEYASVNFDVEICRKFRDKFSIRGQ